MAGQIIPGMMAANQKPADDMPTNMRGIYQRTIGAPSPIALPSSGPDQGYWDRLLGFLKSMMQRR